MKEGCGVDECVDCFVVILGFEIMLVGGDKLWE